MEALHFGVDRTHAPGEYCHRTVFGHWLICCFATPFLYETEGGMERGEAGQMLLMAPGHVVYHGPVAEDQVFVNDWIQVAGADFGALLERYPLPLNTPFSVADPGLLGRRIRRISEELLLAAPGYREKVDCTLTEAVIDLHRLYHKLRYLPLSRIEGVREQMLRFPAREWTLAEMAACSGYAVSRFSELYRKRFGSAPKADLLQIRLRLATRLLLTTTLSVGEIAEQCGYKSVYHFSKSFKKQWGIAPGDYRRTSAVYR